MKQAWSLDDVMKYLKAELEKLKGERTKRQIELNCFSREVDNLEDIVFKLERETEVKE